jgi:cytochrome b6-f complex iron-sulfur subunit
MTQNSIQPDVDDKQSPRDPARRNLLNGLWLGMGGIALAEVLWLAVSFLKPIISDHSSDHAESLIDAGPVSRFAPNTVTAFPRGRFYLACLEDGGILALSRRCTHLGCTVPWDPKKNQFACPCHASVFSIRGDVIQSPAPRPLDRFSVSIENGRVNVDVSRPIRRSAFHDDQVVYP